MLQEGIAINQSLSALSRVIQAALLQTPERGLLCAGFGQALAGSAGSGIVPVFRESKLTLLLKARTKFTCFAMLDVTDVCLGFTGRA